MLTLSLCLLYLGCCGMCWALGRMYGAAESRQRIETLRGRIGELLTENALLRARSLPEREVINAN